MGMGEFIREQWQKQGIGWPGVGARGDSLIVPLGGWDADAEPPLTISLRLNGGYTATVDDDRFWAILRAKDVDVEAVLQRADVVSYDREQDDRPPFFGTDSRFGDIFAANVMTLIQVCQSLTDYAVGWRDADATRGRRVEDGRHFLGEVA